MSTTIKISKSLALILDEEKKKLGVKSYEDVIRFLLRERRNKIIKEFFGIDRGKITKFTEDDRLDSRI